MRKTPEQVREQFVRDGRSISEWAREHGYSRRLVVYVLCGGRARRGESHDIAVALGIKKGRMRRQALAAHAAAARS